MNRQVFRIFWTGLLTALFLSGGCAYAREPYHVGLRVNLTTANVSAPNLVDLKRDLTTVAIQELIPIYNPNSPLSLDINLRGVMAVASFALNSTTLVVDFPNIGISETFDGGTRDNSVALFKDYLIDGGDRHKLFRAYARYSPIDPMAGNPNSLMSIMAEADYNLGRLYPKSCCDCFCYSQPVIHEFQSGSSFVRGFTNGYETSSATLPFRYSYSPCRTWAFILDAPLTYNKNGGASSITGSVGFGLRYPFSCNWSLTPVFRMGSGVSLDLVTGSLFCSFGATSAYDLKVKQGIFSLINYIGYTTSATIWTTGVNWNYNIYDYFFKNGFVYTPCKGFSICGRELNFNLFFEDTALAGKRVYMMHYDEVGVSLFTKEMNRRICWDSCTFSFAYQFGKQDYEGYRFKLLYQF